MNYMFVNMNQKESGAFSLTELKNLIATGDFTAQDMVYIENEDQWVEAERVEELKKLFAKTTEYNHHKRIFAIGGGKGGVGKTVLTASLGIGLATLGKEVVLVDADLGGANLHTCMGILEPRYSYYHYYTQQCKRLQDIVLDTPIENLKLISGANGILGLANPRYSQKLRFLNALRNIDADYILLDLGAGSSYNVIDFFLTADEGIIVTSPDPMAMQDSLGFLKVCLLRRLYRTFKKHKDIMNLLETNSIASSGRMISNMEDIRLKISEMDKNAGETIEHILSEFCPKLVLNIVRNANEIKQGTAFQVAAAESLSLDVDFLGYMEYDERILSTIKSLRPFVINEPRSNVSKSLAKIISLKLEGNNGLQGFRTKRRLTKKMIDMSRAYPSPDTQKVSTICSIRCYGWDDCEYQNGGFPCAVRQFEPVFNI